MCVSLRRRECLPCCLRLRPRATSPTAPGTGAKGRPRALPPASFARPLRLEIRRWQTAARTRRRASPGPGLGPCVPLQSLVSLSSLFHQGPNNSETYMSTKTLSSAMTISGALEHVCRVFLVPVLIPRRLSAVFIIHVNWALSFSTT